ncbi:hypothetical protein DM01DRAFT_1336794 [Hesseltinella vesiculosa]|uniref:Uncharacterized protein n=1 Tax=Hesseltinella vesiculosa TaxID=101127 RepID=A0A1X2GF98_9FUNG|nr:hypothetical protein DM01DRAFT_1336794 [Hesseltinella vesiculosa]
MVLRQPIASLTRLTLKYAGNPSSLLFLTPSDHHPEPDTLLEWLHDAQDGMDAFFDDQFDLAFAHFSPQAKTSPFHAMGHALIAYAEAMVSFDSAHIETAQDRLISAEALCHQFAKRSRRRPTPGSAAAASPPPLFVNDALAYELLQSNCTLMSATLQFLSNRWVDYMRGAYKLRKTYKKYEQMFEWITGESTNDYPRLSNKRRKKKYSLYNNKKKKSTSSLHHPPCSPSTSTSSTASPQRLSAYAKSPWSLKGGIFFGLGLLILIFSLLPPKLAKVLNTFGFYASRPFALQLLQEAYHLQDDLYSPLSAMALLAYYTSLSSFIHPALLPSSFSLAKARDMMDAIKTKYPHGKIGKLLEGKLCRMEGDLTKSIQVLRDCRRRDSVCTSVWQLNEKHQQKYESLASRPTDPPSPCLQEFQSLMVSELSLQISALSVYEMGWDQIFLGDYFQASETFFRLESMNNWSRAFYHYIATCCLYADEEYDKAALDFLQIPRLLARRQRQGGRLLPNEQFADHVIRQWMAQAKQNGWLSLTGDKLQQVARVHPLWELIYVWHGLYHVPRTTLKTMQHTLQHSLDALGKWSTTHCSERARLYLLLGAVQRELANHDHAETCFKRVLMLEKVCHLHHRHDAASSSSSSSSSSPAGVSWAGPFAHYELAVLKLLGESSSADRRRQSLVQAKDHLQKVDTSTLEPADTHDDWTTKDVRYEAVYMILHVRCQLLLEKIDELADP